MQVFADRARKLLTDGELTVQLGGEEHRTSGSGHRARTGALSAHL
jgi:hypothetical protein